MLRRSLVAVVAVVGLTTVACSSPTTTGTPTPASSPPNSASAPAPTTAQALPYAGAPKVASPLPASVLSGDPCMDALTPDQIKSVLGAAETGKRGDSAGIGPGCDWANLDSGSHLAVSYDNLTHTGLSGVYANIQPKAQVWKVLPPIQGFPAVAHVTPSGGALDTFCAITVGLADNLSVDVSIFLSDSKKGTVNPCDADAQVAPLVVTTLRQKAGS